MTNWEKSVVDRLDRIDQRLTRLEFANMPLGPNPKQDEELERERERERLIERIVNSAKQVPVDRSQRILVSGDQVPEDHSHTELKENGQQRDYIVLSADERSKGSVRPYRDAYRHAKCGKITTMSRAIAETYARDPHFYTGTFCTTCCAHFPIGETGEFTWHEMDGSTGPKVGT